MVEATLPMAISLKWVAYACRMAGAAKPKWSREHARWTTTTQSADGTIDEIVITAPAANRVRVISYGKEKQFCTEQNESCWQQNRRAQFSVDR